MHISRGSIYHNASGSICRIVTRIAGGRAYFIGIRYRYGRLEKTLGGSNSTLRAFREWLFNGHTPPPDQR